MTTVEATPAARRARHFRWLERRLFEILGGWVPSEPDPEVKLVLRSHSFQHAWHADLWRGLLPPGGEEPFPKPDPDQGPRGPLSGKQGPSGPLSGKQGPSGPLSGKQGRGLYDFLGAVAQPAGTLERLTGAYRVVLPGLVSAYSTCREETTAAAGGPALRVLGLILADDVEACRVGERLVQRYSGSPGADPLETDHGGRLESILLASGGMNPGVIV